MFRSLVFTATVFFLAAVDASAAIIDHEDVAGVASLSQTTMNTIGRQTWFFSHASVGSNIISGMSGLHSSNPTRYQLNVVSEDGIPPCCSIIEGTVYEYSRGNPGWEAKFANFNSYVDAGWHSPKVGFAMDKLCYIDQDASATDYIDLMSGLEDSYPDTVFVYTTMPLTTGEDSSNVLRNEYNETVRTYCGLNGKLLFDIADIEAYDLAGNACTFTYEGEEYQKLYSGYTGDGGHLNVTGSQQVALGWYAAAAVPEPGTIALLLIGGAGLGGVGIVRRRRSF